MQKSKQNPASCDCCEGVEVLTPVALFNRPGLDAITYRVGTHASFLETMKARLSSSAFPKLAELTTRESRDASIALLDAWATVGDVLTFYQERIANEGYLRTAIERRSVLELARLVGYRLKPGLSASVYLAYILEPTQPTTVIEIGNKAQSIPGPNELPQIFETADKLIAHSGLNSMTPRLTRPQLHKGLQSFTQITIAARGSSLGLRVNDGVLLELALLESSQVGDTFYRVSEVTTAPELDQTILKLDLQGDLPPFPAISGNLPADAKSAVQAIVKKYAEIDAFGLSPTSKTVEKVINELKTFGIAIDSFDPDTLLLSKIGTEREKLLAKIDEHYALASTRGWDNIASWLSSLIDDLKKLEKSLALSTDTGHNLGNGDGDDTPPGVASFVELFRPFKLPQSMQPNGEAHLNRNIRDIFSPRSEFVGKMYSVINPQAAPFVGNVLANASSVAIAARSPKTAGVISLTNSQALRLRAFLAGRSLPIVTRETFTGTGTSTGTTTVEVVSPPSLRAYLDALEEADFQAEAGVELKVIALDAEYGQIKVGSKVVIQHPRGKVRVTSVHTVQRVDLSELTFRSVSVPSTVLTLDPAWLNSEETAGDHLTSNAVVRGTTVFAQNEALALAEIEIADDLVFESTDTNPIIELDGLYSNLESGRWTIISGERVVIDTRTKQPVNTGVIVSELVMVASVAHEAKLLVDGELVEVKGEKLHTFLHPAQPPAFRYRRSTVKVYGNVVRATHGETRTEVLGSGDGSKPLQSFQLLQPPLTYLPAPNPSGTDTTLAVRVNDVLWKESDNLFVLGPDIRKYITRTDDAGKTSVIFGDGEHGSRLPTGVENVRAVYRQGIGKGGNVKAEQIKLPLTKPLGVKGVINPLPAGGGVDKETRDQARRNAPIAVLALDRLVSVQDYADFARTFAGIAKASAQRLSDGRRDVVHLTIAGAGNITIDQTSDLYRNLLAALRRFGDPLQPVEIDSFERVLLVVSAKVNVLPEYLWEVVKEKMRATLWEKLEFDSRELGQDVTLSEVLSLMQSVPGVNYVDFDVLDSVSEATLTEPEFGKRLKLRGRVNANLAGINEAGDDILPAQLVFLSRDAVDTLILEEVAAV